MAEAVLDGSVFHQKQVARERAEAKVKGASIKANPLERYGDAQSLLLRAEAEAIKAQHNQRILTQAQKEKDLTTVRDRLSKLRHLRQKPT